MRPAGGLWPEIASFHHLRAAALRAARGKRRVRGVAAFLSRLEPEALSLERELESGTYRPGRAFEFRIFDPKERTIAAAPFRDRVVHHALIDRLEPLFERRMIATSFACRRGKGTHAAIACARRLVRTHGFHLKLDIRKCFESIRHDVAMATLGKVVKDRRVLDLFAAILEAGSGRESGVGLPIGALTSQWIANLVLDRLDHFVKEKLRVPGYLRYMDDFALFDDEKARLAGWLPEVDRFVREALELALKEKATRLAPHTEGLPFLGWRIFRGTTRLRAENKRRSFRRLRLRWHEHAIGRRNLESVAASARSLCEHLSSHGNTLGLQRSWFRPERCREPPAPAHS